ncbi:hypothetical protein V8C26DRAFT_102713 [Trichoderma gracile]
MAPARANFLASCSVMIQHSSTRPPRRPLVGTTKVVHACICTYKSTRQLSTCRPAHKHTCPSPDVKRPSLCASVFETGCERSHKDTWLFVHIEMFGFRLDDLPSDAALARCHILPMLPCSTETDVG